MSFLTNRAVNLINIHAALKRLAIEMGEIFGAIYLYDLGVPLHKIFLAWAAIFLIRIFVRPFGLWLIHKRGLRKSVLLGSILFSAYYLILGQVGGLDWWLVTFVVYAAIADTLYWLPYHAYFAALGDAEHRGKQVGVRESLIRIAATLGPLTGGLLINTFGFYAAFLSAAFLCLVAAIPVYLAPEVKIGRKISWRQAWKQRAGFWLFVGDGWGYNAHIFTWNIILFILLGNVATFGMLLSLAAVFQIIGLLLLGRGVDQGNGKQIYRIGITLSALVVLGRAIFADTVAEVIFFDVLFAIQTCFYCPAFNTALYNSAKKSPNVAWFHFFAESGWDVGAMIALGTASLITYCGSDTRWVLAFSLGGLSIVAAVLEKYYKHHRKFR